jgi:hypothetical protein
LLAGWRTCCAIVALDFSALSAKGIRFVKQQGLSSYKLGEEPQHFGNGDVSLKNSGKQELRCLLTRTLRLRFPFPLPSSKKVLVAHLLQSRMTEMLQSVNSEDPFLIPLELIGQVINSRPDKEPCQ